MNKSLILHFRPKMVDTRALKFSLTFGLGGMALVLIILLFFTGLLLKFHYLPFPDRAYDSVLFIKGEVFFGAFIRNIHYWSANFLIIVTFLHMLRVFFTSAFHSPRQVNWVIGVALLIIVLCFNFTGYLLPWDQLSFWAVTICTGMMDYIPFAGKWLQSIIRGGAEVDSTTLSVFFATHTALLPAAMIILAPFHFWRIRKAGGIALPIDNGKNIRRVYAIPDLLLREVVTALVLTALILIISILFDAPLGDRANPGLSPNPTKAPWYFMGFQEILLHVDPFLAVCVIPLFLIMFLLLLPWMKCSIHSQGIWFISKKGKQSAIFSSIAALLLAVIAIIANDYLSDYSALMNGVVLIAALSLFYLLLIKKYHPERNEKVQAISVFLISAFITFTLTGIWFRGSGMKLIWPWQ